MHTHVQTQTKVKIRMLGKVTLSWMRCSLWSNPSYSSEEQKDNIGKEKVWERSFENKIFSVCYKPIKECWILFWVGGQLLVSFVFCFCFNKNLKLSHWGVITCNELNIFKEYSLIRVVMLTHTAPPTFRAGDIFPPPCNAHPTPFSSIQTLSAHRQPLPIQPLQFVISRFSLKNQL